MSKTPFLPVRGTDASIHQQEPINGRVWFATDTRKIYYSNGESFVSMGGNSGIYYGRMQLDYTPEENEKEFDFSPDEIEGNEEENIIIPNVDDLIFNIPDNSFYRVLEVERDSENIVLSIHTRLLTIAGGGGSGGGSGSGETEESVIFEQIGDTVFTVLTGASCLLNFSFRATDIYGNAIQESTATVYIGGKKINDFSIVEGENSLDIGNYLEQDINRIQVDIEVNVGGSKTIKRRRYWTVNKINLEVNWPYTDNTIQQNNNIVLSYSVNTSFEHQVHIKIDNLTEVLLPISHTSNVIDYALSRRDYGLSHGAHILSMYATATINGEVFTSNSVQHTIICVDEDNASPIIGFANYTTSMQQYNTLLIPIIVYDPDTVSDSISVLLFEDNVQKDTWEIPNGSQNIWSYTPLTAGPHRLLVTCGESEEFQDIEVIPLDIDITEIPGYEFKFKASDFISNNSVQNWNSNGVTATFSNNFDWINGGLHIEQTENGSRNYFCIKAGTSMTINYTPFAHASANKGKTIKFIYKATNCKNYDAQVLSCVEERELNDGRIMPIGLKVNAQATIMGGTTNFINIPTCEDTYIELEMDLWDSEVITENRIKDYLMAWINGIPVGCKRHQGAEFIQNQNIVIGSNDCDVYVYLLKSYDKHLSEEQHLMNFIADAYNANEMVERFRRNDILGDNNDISFQKLALAAPKVKLHLYDIPRMTTAKGDEVNNCSYSQYYGSLEPEVTAEEATISGQGTSSSAYGISAFNIDTEFKSGFNLRPFQDNEHVDGYSMTPTSIPVNYFNTKVNVASCEGANNALNQEWYNRYQPYICEYRAKNKNRTDNKLARDTMEFPYPGILFIKDNNENLNYGVEHAVENNVFNDTPNYLENKYYKMYAICNMGNSKKNIDVFHDKTNPYECCIEVLDNQRPEQQMVSFSQMAIDNHIENNLEAAVYTDDQGNDQKAYEFRFPKSKDMKKNNPEKIVEFSNAWFRFVSWMMENNPNNATNEPITPEDYGTYTFRGYTSSKTGYQPEYEVLAGTEINTYRGHYEYDTKERRIAKMLNECEDYLIMDAIVFHYLMIERHTMIDNVAKNTFWTTEDLVHWAPIKDYDNDTSDGNDNQGVLSLRYGYETSDLVDGQSNTVFNASNSVWLNFIAGLYQARKIMYRELETKGAWDAKNYLKLFEEYQNAIPERCWIYDYHRKYLRPYEVYGEPRYLSMLEGGKKTTQRKQYETYQEIYTSSEYAGAATTSSRIEFRGNNPSQDIELGEKKLYVTMYSDCYINIGIGSGGTEPNINKRAKRNIPIEVTVPVNDLSNATIYFYNAGNITELDGISTLFCEAATIGAGIKLRRFVLGSDDYQNTNLREISFGTNKMMEELYLQNCPNLMIPLDLSNLTSLKELDTEGSGFTSIIIADNAPVQSLRLNSPVELELTNLYNLQELTLESYNNIMSLFINNIDNSLVNSKNILIEACKNNVFSSYMFKNVQWIINDSEELDSANDAAILILNELLDSRRHPRKKVNKQIEASTRQEAVTGNLTITEEAYNGTNSLNIYNYYAFGEDTDFPNLNINFEGSNSKLCTVNIYNRRNEIVWSKKIIATADIDSEFLSSGPNGSFDSSLISNDKDTQNTYTFNNSWTIQVDGVNIDTINNAEPIYNNLNGFDGDIINLIPNYSTAIRKYNISFNVNNEITTVEIPYGTLINNYAANEIFPNGLIKSDEDLPLKQTYSFNGWSLTSNGLIISDEATVNGELTLYAIFNAVDVHNNINPSLFNTTDLGNNKIQISPKNALALQGKVTIPTEIDGKIVSSLYNFKYCYNLTHLFFQENSQVSSIMADCFIDLSNLIYFEPNDSLITIGANAFRNTGLRVDLQDEDYIIGGNNLQEINREAFRYALHSNNINRIVIIPSSVTKIEVGAFANESLSQSTIQIGNNKNNPSNWDVLNVASFAGSSKNILDWIRFYMSTGAKLLYYTNQYNSWNQVIKTFTNGDTLLLIDIIADAPSYLAEIRLQNGDNYDDWVNS